MMFGFEDTLRGAGRGLLLYSVITPGHSHGTIAVPRIDLGIDSYRANSLTSVLSLQTLPHFWGDGTLARAQDYDLCSGITFLGAGQPCGAEN